MSFGGTLLLFGAIGAVIAIVSAWPGLRKEWRTSHQSASRASAEELLADRKRVREDPPQPARIEDFSFRGYAFYDRIQRELESHGYTKLGDFVPDLADWVKPGFRAFVRVMQNPDRDTVCSVVDATPHALGLSGMEKLHFHLAGLKHKSLRGVSLRTELSDGRFIITAVDSDFPKEEHPPQILRHIVSRETSVGELLQRHRERVVAAIGGERATTVPIGTVEGFGQSFLRHETLIREWRERIGFAFTDEEQRDFVRKATPFEKGTASSLLESMRTLETRGKNEGEQ